MNNLKTLQNTTGKVRDDESIYNNCIVKIESVYRDKNLQKKYKCIVIKSVSPEVKKGDTFDTDYKNIDCKVYKLLENDVDTLFKLQPKSVEEKLIWERAANIELCRKINLEIAKNTLLLSAIKKFYGSNQDFKDYVESEYQKIKIN